MFAEVAQVRVQATLKIDLPCPYHRAHAREPTSLTQTFELLVHVEHKRRPSEPACVAGAGRVQSNDEKGPSREAEREVRVFGVGAYGRVPAMMQPILFVEPLKLRPQKPLEVQLVGRLGFPKASQERRETAVDGR